MLGFAFCQQYSVQAQGLKFAHINSQELIASMPESDSAQRKLQAFEKDIMEQLDQLRVEINKKYQDYLQNRETLSPSILQTRERELQDLQQRMQEYQMAAQKDFQDLQQKLMQPILEKAHNAIKKVGKAGGYLYVFDTSVGTVLYQSEQSVDVLADVKKELGIK